MNLNSYATKVIPVWRNWIARLASNQKVVGSSPTMGISRVAQLVEHRSYEPKVLGSSPSTRIVFLHIVLSKLNKLQNDFSNIPKR